MLSEQEYGGLQKRERKKEYGEGTMSKYMANSIFSIT
jgi:hypothetical protein